MATNEEDNLFSITIGVDSNFDIAITIECPDKSVEAAMTAILPTIKSQVGNAIREIGRALQQHLVAQSETE